MHRAPGSQTLQRCLCVHTALHRLTLNTYNPWPFSSADLYNWKTNHTPVSGNPSSLTGLIESLMFSHQPMWDDCQQLLQVLFTTKEKERILLEARKNVPGTNSQPTQPQNEIDAGFPLHLPDWDYNSIKLGDDLQSTTRLWWQVSRGLAGTPPIWLR